MPLLAETGSAVIEPLQGTTVIGLATSNGNAFNAIEPLQGTTVLGLATSNGNAFNAIEPLQGTTVVGLAISNGNGFNVIEPLQWSTIAGLPVSNSSAFNVLEPLLFNPVPGFLTPYGVGPYTISGTVQNGSSAPLARTVIAYNRDTRIPLDITTSDPVTGAFTLNVQFVPCFVVCLPLLSDGVNAEVYDNITPVL